MPSMKPTENTMVTTTESKEAVAPKKAAAKKAAPKKAAPKKAAEPAK